MRMLRPTIRLLLKVKLQTVQFTVEDPQKCIRYLMALGYTLSYVTLAH